MEILGKFDQEPKQEFSQFKTKLHSTTDGFENGIDDDAIEIRDSHSW
jgi:hypothetical protein